MLNPPNVILNAIYHDAVWCDWILDGKRVTLGYIYRSPSDTESCDLIYSVISEASSQCDHLLITGDFNLGILIDRQVHSDLLNVLETATYFNM